jgi:hypothetical protein
LRQAGNDYQSLLKATDDWFNAQMDRVAGWYRRQSQYMLIVIAAVVVLLTGVDSVELAQRLYANPSVAAAAVQSIRDSASRRNANANAGADATTPADDPATRQRIIASAEGLLTTEDIRDFFHPFAPFRDAATPDQMADHKIASDKAEAELKLAQQDVRKKADARKAADDAVRSAPSDANAAAAAKTATAEQTKAEKMLADASSNARAARRLAATDLDQNAPYRHLPGMLMTVIALSLGGPFWFDALGKLINVRMSGAKPVDSTSSTKTT